MVNYFNFNFSFPFGMNNWFMPNWSFQIPSFDIFSSWFSPINYNNFYSQTYQPSIFYQNFSYTNPFDTFIKKTKEQTEPKSNPSSVYSVTTPVPASKIDYKKDSLKLDDYNAFKGERLANTALNRSVGWTGYCARYVKNSIQSAGLGSYQYGHAYQMTDILRNNKNFKEISIEGVNVKDLPAGCVLVYGKGVQGYSKNYGHTEITTGDGRAVSDGITKNLHKKPSAIFIPV